MIFMSFRSTDPFSEDLADFTAHVVAWKWHRLRTLGFA